MANDQDRNQNPTTGSESDISKAQSPQQPQGQTQREKGEQAGQFETGQQEQFGQDLGGAAPDEGLQGETLSQQRTDIEGASGADQERGEAESGFVGAEGQQDTSSELIEEEDEDFEKDGQGATDE
jgi:hypothetical protein